MFHVELRQFPHVTRAFNLTREELHSRILGPWVTSAPIDLNDRRWLPEKTRLTILEGAELRPDEIGLGRGWANAGRGAEDVTAALVGEAEQRVETPSADGLKDALVELCARGPEPLRRVVELAGERHPQRRPSELLAAAEQAVWELLHQGRLTMLVGSEPVEPDQWQRVLMSWDSWTGAEVGLDAKHTTEGRFTSNP
jgi:hypothetical protein